MDIALRYTVSQDGTKLAYYQLGTGPGIIIVHGAMQSGLSQSELALALAKDYTCYLPDRRGRGKSGPSVQTYCLQREIEDIEAIHTTTGARYLFGVSSGALIVLRSALVAHPSHFDGVAVFEPPWWPDTLIEESTSWVARYEDEINRGEIAEALTTAMLGVKMGPPLFQSKYFPRPVLTLLSRLMIKADKSSQSKKLAKTTQQDIMSDQPTFEDLAYTLRNDIKITSEMSGDDNFDLLSGVEVETLILGASRSPEYLKNSVRILEKIIPHASFVEFQGYDHGMTGNKSHHGSPQVVASELLKFFISQDATASST
ncbi:hypothetical protein PV10_02554 [Exophiala mesophila]|uniref:AB hydrolase-1 domain-containing protein n=1 Tax=Exophiala mesophila TaxID=212818 RepID=A0A0D1ZJL7_EXOME|nr:uncharacterized protein PV10_02554 [Exophiala mesophila]KIV94822.1 hypothetical protein PV10_02554 [Exophiala mesophila]